MASLPLSTHYGFGQALLLPTLLGSPLGLVERFDHRSMLRLLADGTYAYWAATPLMADTLARAPLPGPVPAVPRICHISAGRLSVRVFDAFRDRFGVALRPNYGQTENGFITVNTAPDDQIDPGNVGRPAPGIELRVGEDPSKPYPAGTARAGVVQKPLVYGRLRLPTPASSPGSIVAAGGSPGTWGLSTRRDPSRWRGG